MQRIVTSLWFDEAELRRAYEEPIGSAAGR